MMITLRVVATLSSSLPLDERRLRPDAENAHQLGEIADLELRRARSLGQGRRVPVDPHRVHADSLRSRHVEIRAIADVDGLARADAELPQGDQGVGMHAVWINRDASPLPE